MSRLTLAVPLASGSISSAGFHRRHPYCLSPATPPPTLPRASGRLLRHPRAPAPSPPRARLAGAVPRAPAPPAASPRRPRSPPRAPARARRLGVLLLSTPTSTSSLCSTFCSTSPPLRCRRDGSGSATATSATHVCDNFYDYFLDYAYSSSSMLCLGYNFSRNQE